MTFPLIGYDNLLEQGIVTVTDEAVGYPKANAYDWLGYDWWQAGSSGEKFMTVDMGANVTAPADFIALASHTLGTTGTRLKLQYSSDGTTWTDAHTTLSPTDDTPLMTFFTQRNVRHYRAKFTPKHNYIPNNTMQGAVAGTPGTVPTGWSITSSATGITREIVGTGVEGGVEYIDVRYSGTATSSGVVEILPMAPTDAAAVTGETWTGSLWAKLVAGTLPSTPVFQWDERDGTGTSIAMSTPALIDAASILTRFFYTLTLSGGASTAYVTYLVNIQIPNSSAVDFTIRIGLPQLEKCDAMGQVQKTSGTAVFSTCGLVGMLAFGKALQVPVDMPVGFRPLHLARQFDNIDSEGQTGVFIGRSVRERGATGELQFRDLPHDWIRTYWQPFLTHAKAKPFFFAWDIDGHPTEIALCWATAPDLDGPSYSAAGFMSTTLKVRAMI